MKCNCQRQTQLGQEINATFNNMPTDFIVEINNLLLERTRGRVLRENVCVKSNCQRRTQLGQEINATFNNMPTDFIVEINNLLLERTRGRVLRESVCVKSNCQRRTQLGQEINATFDNKVTPTDLIEHVETGVLVTIKAIKVVNEVVKA